MKNRYAEAQAGPNDETDYFWETAAFPSGSERYSCDLDTSTGEWVFYYAGSQWASFTHNGWKNVVGNRIDYNGEIKHKNTQMAGIATEKCEFRNCKVRLTGGGYVLHDIEVDEFFTDDSDEWGYEPVGTTPTNDFNIWDKQPPFNPNL